MSDRAAQIREDSTADTQSRTLFTVLTIVGLLFHTTLLIAGLVYLPLLTAHINSSSIPVAYAVFAAVMGFIPAYLLRSRVKPGIYTAVSVIDSLIIGVLSGVGAIIHRAFKQLQQFEQQLNLNNQTAGGELASGSASTLNSGGLSGAFEIQTPLHPDITFVLLLLLFNAPFLYYLHKQRALSWKLLVLYLLPVLAYIGTQFLLGSMILEAIVSSP